MLYTDVGGDANRRLHYCGDCQLLNIIYQIFSLADRHKIVRLPCVNFEKL